MSKLILPSHQYSNTNDYKKEWVQIQPSSQPQWNSNFTFDVRLNNILLHNLIMQFNLGPVQGGTGLYLTPADFFIHHVELALNSQLIATYYPTSNFIGRSLFEFNEDSSIEHLNAGLFNVVAQRQTLAATNSTYFLHLKSFYDQIKGLPVVNLRDQLQMRVYLQPLDKIVGGTVTGTLSCQINSINLMAKVSYLPETIATAIRMKPIAHYKFSECKPFPYVVQAGTTSANIVLSSIVGPVPYFYFVCRDTAKVESADSFKFNAIQSYELFNGAQQNIIGGNVITHAQNTIIANDHVMSNHLILNSLGVDDQKQNIYLYAFCENATYNWRDCVGSSSYNFTGSEVLRVNFGSALTTTTEVTVYAFVDMVLEVKPNAINKGTF